MKGGWTLGAFLGAVLAALVAVPVVARRDVPVPPKDAAKVIVITPHNEQIRQEFGEGFARWHQARFGTPAAVIWNTPGGTSEIRKILEASTLAALRDGVPVGGNADLFFGGGTYEFEQLKKPMSVEVDGERRSASVLAPVELDPAFLASVYGDNDVGGRPMRDPDGYWFGAALSAFGIVWNRESLDRLGVPAPTGWAALADPRLQGQVAMVNPAQSGSVATAMETILHREGWSRGWAILRRAAASARSVSASATRAPIEVSQGEAAIALCIDFYGRYQQQVVADGGSPDRIGYMDPVGMTAIDPDPVAMLRGAPHPETARRFIEFVLSPEGQRLWQYPVGAEGGPRMHALRRIPASRAVHAADRSRFIDQVDPWEIARAIPNPDPNVRSFVAPLFVAMAIDCRSLAREAWAAVAAHPEYPRDGSVLRAQEARDPRLRRMLEAFDAMPAVPAPDGASLVLDGPANLAAVRDGWLRGKWAGMALWNPIDSPADVLRRTFAEQVAARMREVIAISREGGG